MVETNFFTGFLHFHKNWEFNQNLLGGNKYKQKPNHLWTNLKKSNPKIALSLKIKYK